MIIIIPIVLITLYKILERNKVKRTYKGFWQNYGDEYFGAVKDEVFCYSLLVLVVTFCISCILICFVPRYDDSYKFNINSMKDNLVTEGYMYYRRGNVDGELSYFFSRTTNKGEVIGHVPADSSYIKYDDNVHPNIEVHQDKFDWDNATWWKVIDPWLYLYEKLGVEPNKNKEYIITVPSDTLTEQGNYEIDME